MDKVKYVSTLAPTREYLETNGELIDEFAGGEASYRTEEGSWYVRFDGTVEVLITDDDHQ